MCASNAPGKTGNQITLKASKETSPLDYFGITNLQKRERIHWCYIKATDFLAIYDSCNRTLIYYNVLSSWQLIRHHVLNFLHLLGVHSMFLCFCPIDIILHSFQSANSDTPALFSSVTSKHIVPQNWYTHEQKDK